MSYNGDALYAWQVQEPDGGWAIVGALVPGIDMVMPLVGRSREAIVRAGPIARTHALEAGQHLRFVRFDLGEVLPL